MKQTLQKSAIRTKKMTHNFIWRLLLVFLAFVISGIGQVFGTTATYAQQQPDLSALESTGYYMSLPPTATSAEATAVQNGYMTWMSIIGNDSSMPVDNASISYMSGYDPSRFDSVPSFPFTSTFTTLEPGQREIAKLLPGDNDIPVSFNTGYSSTKTTSPNMIPVGGGQQTVTVTMTPVDSRYIETNGVNTSLGLFVYSDIPGVTIASITDPTNLDQGEDLQTTNISERIQWQLAHPQINKTYTFTAILNVPNNGNTPLNFQPTAHTDGQRQTVLSNEQAGQAVTIVNSSLDGDVPGSGAVTFSVDQTDRTWQTKHAEIFSLVYEGTQQPGPQQPIPVDILVKPGGGEPASINPRSHGVIPVAVLSTDSFDATTIDPATVLFGPMGPTKASPVHTSLEDVNQDGKLDMVLHFHTQETGIVCGVGSAGLNGLTTSGQSINGGISIKTVGCK